MPISGLASNEMVTEAQAATGGFQLNSGQSHGNSTLCMTKASAFTKYDLALNTNTNAVSNNQLLRNDLWVNALPYYTYVFEGNETTEGADATCTNHAGPYNMYSDKSTMTMPITIYLDRYLNIKFSGTGNFVLYHAGQLVTITGSTGEVSSITTCTAPDTTSPTTPSLTNPGNFGTFIRVSWSPSTDASGIAYYEVWRDVNNSGIFNVVGQTSNTTYDDSLNIYGGDTYYYKIKAIDNASNGSAFSNTRSITL